MSSENGQLNENENLKVSGIISEYIDNGVCYLERSAGSQFSSFEI